MAAFKVHLRDFLIQLKEFSDADELYIEEKEAAMAAAKAAEQKRMASVPGLLPQSDVPHDDMND